MSRIRSKWVARVATLVSTWRANGMSEVECAVCVTESPPDICGTCLKVTKTTTQNALPLTWKPVKGGKFLARCERQMNRSSWCQFLVHWTAGESESRTWNSAFGFSNLPPPELEGECLKSARHWTSVLDWDQNPFAKTSSSPFSSGILSWISNFRTLSFFCILNKDLIRLKCERYFISKWSYLMAFVWGKGREKEREGGERGRMKERESWKGRKGGQMQQG